MRRSKRRLRQLTNGLLSHAPQPPPPAPAPPPPPPPPPETWVTLVASLPEGNLKHGMRMGLVQMTPELAFELLKRANPENRRVDDERVGSHIVDILGGNYKILNDLIVIGPDGVLVNGHHRTTAIFKSGRTVEVLVLYNPTADIKDPYDRVRVRSVATCLGLHARDVAALNVVRMFEWGQRIRTPATVAEISAAHDRHRDVLAAINEIPQRGRLQAGTLAAGVWARACEPRKVDEFIGRAATGEMIARGHPAYAFRAWQERNRSASSYEVGLAALNCLRHFVNDVPLTAVYTGEAGYRAFCGRRRALRVPHTPGADIVLGLAWVPSKQPGRESADVEGAGP